MSDVELAYALRWNNNAGVAMFALLSYDYILQFEKEVKFFWTRKWSLMACLYFAVRYFGLVISLLCACWGGMVYMPYEPCYVLGVTLEWGFSVYFWLAEMVLIWRLYALYNQSRTLLYVLLGLFIPIIGLDIGMDIFLYSRPVAFSAVEIVTPNVRYCTETFNLGPMPALYTSIPIICWDISLVILAVVILVKHLKERKEIKMKPNVYILVIVRSHIIYFILNLLDQILLTIVWAPKLSTPVMILSEMFVNTAPFIIAPRLIIGIWNSHADDQCAHISTAFEDCICWTLPPSFEQHEQQEQHEIEMEYA